MLQTVLVAGVAPLQNNDEILHWENRPFTGIWPEIENGKKDITRNKIIKKKNKRVRTAFTTDQIRTLEKTFLKNKYINSENRRELSKLLKIDDKCIKIWFQNKRMKEKRESSESSDSSSETVRDVLSPPLTQHEPEVDHKTDVYHHQYPQQAQYAYYQPHAFHTFIVNAPYDVNQQDQVYEPPSIDNGPNDFGSLAFCNETNPYPTQYYPNNEADVNGYMYQNQYQYGNKTYNWGINNSIGNIDSYTSYYSQ